MGLSKDETRKRLNELDEIAGRFNEHLVAPIKMIKSYLPREAADEVESTLRAIKIGIAADRAIVIAAVHQSEFFQKTGDSIMARKEEFFMNSDIAKGLEGTKGKLKNAIISQQLGKYTDYYAKILSAIREAWKSIDERTKCAIWDQVLSMYEAYLEYML